MSWAYNSYNWRRGTNQYGNQYDHRGDGAASGGTYHYSNDDGSYDYQNRDGSTYYSSAKGHGTYTPANDNPRSYEASESEEEERVAKPRARKSKRTAAKKPAGKVIKAKKAPSKHVQQKPCR